MAARIDRPFWSERLAAGWKQASIVWLTGPRRVGKTVLAQSLPDAEFLNCDLPGVAERLRDPESFYGAVKKRLVVFDEVHQLPDPSRLLKIGADEFPQLRILATGLRRWRQRASFGIVSRAGSVSWSLCRCCTRSCRRSAWRTCGKGCCAAVCHARGWDHLRTDDCGVLWEHLVLDTLIATGLPKVHFWRDKQPREVDFVVPRGRDAVEAIECKWKPDAFETRGLAAFRSVYPKGKNYVVSPLPGPAYERSQDGYKLAVVSPGNLRRMFG